MDLLSLSALCQYNDLVVLLLGQLTAAARPRGGGGHTMISCGGCAVAELNFEFE